MKLRRNNLPINWASPKADYDRIMRLRQENLACLAANRGALPRILDYYGNGHWGEFISDFGMTFDPRETDPDLRYRPFILYQRQREYVDWVWERYQRRERGLCKKFRGAGMSWLNAGIAATIWLTMPDAIVTLGSQKAEKVDNGDNDPDSLFWKVRKFIDMLPQLFVPDDWRKGAKTMIVPNPANGSVIRGEIGDQIGRGGRATIAFADEFAELEHQELVESSLSETADTVLYGSTVPSKGGVGSKFYELEHHLPEEQVFVFQWTEDERKRLRPDSPPEEEAWYVKKRSEVSPTVFASQFLLDYSASTSNAFIPSPLILMANEYRRSRVDQPPQTVWRIGVDASGMGNDKTIIWRRRGRLSLEPLVFEKLDGIQLASIVEREAKKLIKLGPVALIGIEQDGPGGSCADQLKYGPFASVVCSVHTGTPLGDGDHYNLRAWLHRQAKEYLEAGDCHIPNDPIFMSQATAIQFEYRGGKLLIESKADYRARFSSGRSRAEKNSGKSPDRWDAFVLTFIPARAKPLLQLAGQPEGLAKSTRWRPLDASLGY
jgi:hypothetical protein